MVLLLLPKLIRPHPPSLRPHPRVTCCLSYYSGPCLSVALSTLRYQDPSPASSPTVASCALEAIPGYFPWPACSWSLPTLIPNSPSPAQTASSCLVPSSFSALWRIPLGPMRLVPYPLGLFPQSSSSMGMGTLSY